MTNTPSEFTGLGIAPKLLEILSKNNFRNPTPIQTQSIPVAIQGKDVIGIAQTGTGKTLAFGIPMLQNLVKHKGKGVVILPTRELALQVDESIHKIGLPLGLRTAVLIGGEDIRKQERKLKADPHVIIGTPGRMIDHLERRLLKLDQTKILVLDEADRMFDMGFAPQIKQIMKHVPASRQTMLFSATMPPEIVGLATSYMKKPTRVEVAPAGTTAKDVSQELFFVDKPDKIALLKSLLAKYQGSVLVFTRTKYEAKKVTRLVKQLNFTCAEIHSNRSLSQRKEALGGFKLGKYRILVATDIAARGIDVSNIELVVNYDLPATAEDYVHRIGRTGRAGAVGHAISFAMPNQRQEVKRIERLIKKALPVSKHDVRGQGHSMLPKRDTQVVGRPRGEHDSFAPHERVARPHSRGPRPPHASRPGARGNDRAARPDRGPRGGSRGNSRGPRRSDGYHAPILNPMHASDIAVLRSGPALPSGGRSRGKPRKKDGRDRHPAPRPGRYPNEEDYTPFRMERIVRKDLDE